MRRLIREPLLHFLVLGTLLFGLYAVLNPSSGAAPEEIVVTAGRIENLASTFAKVWSRPPTAAELSGLIDQYVKEEVLSREARALGLDQNDTVIRRRLQQKMEFVTEDLALATPPTDEELAEWLASHPEDYAHEAQTSLQQVYLDPARRAESLEEDVAALLAALRSRGAGEDVSSLGDSLILPQRVEGASDSALTAQFGKAFTEAIQGLEPGVWHAPVPSAYGVHAVRISERQAGRPATLDEVRAEVERDLAQARREAANQALLYGLLEKYDVTIEWPSPGGEAPADETAALGR